MNLDLINSLEEYWGEVVDVADPLKAGRVKVRVQTVFEQIATEYIPWAAPKLVDSASFEKPYLGEIVQVTFQHGDIKMPKWFRIRKADKAISDENYESLTILKDKDLSQYGLDGKIQITYTKDKGLTFLLDRNEFESEFTVRNDNTIFLRNGATEKTIHISESGISIGSETKSQQPAVVGDDNMVALQMINNTIKNLSELMDSHLSKLSTIAGTQPYTKHLEAPLKIYSQQVKQTIANLHSNNDSFFPETKSTFITLDKT